MTLKKLLRLASFLALATATISFLGCDPELKAFSFNPVKKVSDFNVETDADNEGNPDTWYKFVVFSENVGTTTTTIARIKLFDNAPSYSNRFSSWFVWGKLFNGGRFAHEGLFWQIIPKEGRAIGWKTPLVRSFALSNEMKYLIYDSWNKDSGFFVAVVDLKSGQIIKQFVDKRFDGVIATTRSSGYNFDAANDSFRFRMVLKDKGDTHAASCEVDLKTMTLHVLSVSKEHWGQE